MRMFLLSCTILCTSSSLRSVMLHSLVISLKSALGSNINLYMRSSPSLMPRPSAPK